LTILLRTRRTYLGLALVAFVLSVPVGAQQDHAMHHSDYAEQATSGIASLSRQEHDDLIAGAGMGMARPAELHQYPGPKHVLELVGELALDEQQTAAVEAIHAAMLQRARELGEEIVEKERHLDLRFSRRHIDEAALRSTTAEIAVLYGELRFAHLRAHLETREVLSPEQIEKYDDLRGY